MPVYDSIGICPICGMICHSNIIKPDKKGNVHRYFRCGSCGNHFRTNKEMKSDE